MLDLLADAYHLLLLVGVFTCCVRRTRAAGNRRREACRLGLGLLALAGLVYGMMLLDAVFALWPGFGLDYSTHTAVVMALCYFLWRHSQRPRARWLLPVSLLGYGVFMHYQQYHTWADMGTTALYMSLTITLLVQLTDSFER